MPIMRTREGRIPGIRQGASTLAHQRAWVSLGSRLRWPTTAGNEWVMVCVEHFTKWVEPIPLPSKSSRDSARGFLEGVLSRYGAPGEVLTDQGKEFLVEF